MGFARDTASYAINAIIVVTSVLIVRLPHPSPPHVLPLILACPPGYSLLDPPFSSL